MDEGHTFDSLVESGVITETETGDVRLAETFEKAVRQREAAVETADSEAVLDDLRSVNTPEARVGHLAEIVEVDPEFLARYLAVQEAVDDLGFESSIRVVLLLDQFDDDFPPTEGSPASFFPVRGDRLPAVLRTFPVAVVYVWREECPDCDVVKQDLENLFEEPSGPVSLFSVYGPESAAFLHRNYDVVGGPTTLFVVDGEVDSRLQGAHYEEVVAAEVDELTKTAETRGVL